MPESPQGGRTPSRQFRGIWIPADLWLRPDLCPTEIFLAAEIDALDHPDTGCVATNDYLAAMLKVSAARIKQIVKKLSETVPPLITVTMAHGNRRTMRSNLRFVVSGEPGGRLDSGRTRLDSGRVGGSNQLDPPGESISPPGANGLDPSAAIPSIRVTSVGNSVEHTPRAGPAGASGQGGVGVTTRTRRPPAPGTMPAAELRRRAEAAYLDYPRHVARDEALRAFEKAVGRLARERHGGDQFAAADWLAAKVREYAAARRGVIAEHGADAVQVTPYPSTWLNRGRYDDDATEWTRPPGFNNARRAPHAARSAAERGQYAGRSGVRIAGDDEPPAEPAASGGAARGAAGTATAGGSGGGSHSRGQNGQPQRQAAGGGGAHGLFGGHPHQPNPGARPADPAAVAYRGPGQPGISPSNGGGGGGGAGRF